MTIPADRLKALEILDLALAAGVRGIKLAELLGMGLTTLQRCRSQIAGEGNDVDRRQGSPRHVAHHLCKEERQLILLTYDQQEFAALPLGQIVSHREVRSALPAQADHGVYFDLDRNCYRVLRAQR